MTFTEFLELFDKFGMLHLVVTFSISIFISSLLGVALLTFVYMIQFLRGKSFITLDGGRITKSHFLRFLLTSLIICVLILKLLVLPEELRKLNNFRATEIRQANLKALVGKLPKGSRERDTFSAILNRKNEVGGRWFFGQAHTGNACYAQYQWWNEGLPKEDFLEHLAVLSETSSETLKELNLRTPREYARCRLVLLATKERAEEHKAVDRKINEELVRKIQNLPS